MSAEVRFLQLVQRLTDTETQPATRWHGTECIERRVRYVESLKALALVLAATAFEAICVPRQRSVCRCRSDAAAAPWQKTKNRVVRRQADGFAGLIEDHAHGRPRAKALYRARSRSSNESFAAGESGVEQPSEAWPREPRACCKLWLPRTSYCRSRGARLSRGWTRRKNIATF